MFIHPVKMRVFRISNLLMYLFETDINTENSSLQA